MSEQKKFASFGDIVSGATFVLGVFTACLYFSGWSYVYAFFDHFRIPLLMVDLPAEHILVYGGLVLWRKIYIVLPAILIFSVCLWIYRHFRMPVNRGSLIFLSVICVSFLFFMARIGGLSVAWDDFELQRDSDYEAYPRVWLVMNDENQLLDGKTVADLLSTDCGRLILHTKERVFIIRPIRNNPLGIDTFVLPSSDVKAMRITSNYASCP